jgi:hypothetical protein
MPLTPQITLTATLADITGVDAGTAANPARLLIQLCGFGLTLPNIPGTQTLARIGEYFQDTGSGISTLLWGNDVITPTGDTYYAITVFDGEGNVVQSGAYQFTGSGTIDLSAASQILPPPAPPAGATFAWSEVPSGTIDGTNPTFTLAHGPNPANSLQFYKNGTRMTAGIAFTLSGAVITYESAYIPGPGDTHIAGLYVY